jgi:phospholipase C
MHRTEKRKWREQATAWLLVFAISFLGLGAPARADGERDHDGDGSKTATPIKHVIIIVGENRSFDHLFATYVPKDRHERVLNLLSEGIITAEGDATAELYTLCTAPSISAAVNA